MDFGIGTQIGWLTYDHTVEQGTITKENSSYVWINHHHKPEDCIDKAFVVTVEFVPELLEWCREDLLLKKKHQDHMGVLYELMNKMIRKLTP